MLQMLGFCDGHNYIQSLFSHSNHLITFSSLTLRHQFLRLSYIENPFLVCYVYLFIFIGQQAFKNIQLSTLNVVTINVLNCIEMKEID